MNHSAQVNSRTAEVPSPKQYMPGVEWVENEYWFVCRKSDLHEQHGWKLYISFDHRNINNILDAVSTTLKMSKLPFKYIRTLNHLSKINSGLYGYSQIGKNLVIYMARVNDQVVIDLLSVLEKFRNTSPQVPFSKPFDEGMALSYRYGSFSGDEINIDGIQIKDNRQDALSAIPDGINDELRRFCTVSNHTDCGLQRFLSQYVVIENLQQKARSGIFKAMNMNSNTYTEVILKYGYLNGGTTETGIDGCGFVRNEIWVLRELADSELKKNVPTIIDQYDSGIQAAFIMDFISHVSLASLKESSKLTLSQLETAWNYLLLLHNEGLYWGDAKLDNFLLNKNEDIILCDFETAGSIAEPDPISMSTFSFPKLNFEDPVARDLFHFLSSVIIDKSKIGNREIDVYKLIEIESRNENEKWAQQRLKALLTELVE